MGGGGGGVVVVVVEWLARVGVGCRGAGFCVVLFRFVRCVAGCENGCTVRWLLSSK